MGVLGQAKHSKAASVHSGIILQHMNQGVLHQESAVTKDTQSIGRVHLGLSIMAEGPEPADRAGQSPTQFRGCQAEWINGQRVPSSDHAYCIGFSSCWSAFSRFSKREFFLYDEPADPSKT